MIFMAQDISPNGAGGVSSTNTMNPRNITPASAGSVSPTIISQNAQDRRRRAAAESEERRRQSLAANVERAEVEREYRQLRAEEEAANRRAEQRKEAAKKQTLTFYAGGYFIPSENRHVPVETIKESVYDYLGGKLTGASEPLQTPEEISRYLTIDRSGGASANPETAYRGLNKIVDHVNSLIDTEARENRQIAMAKQDELIARQTFFGRIPAYTPMSEEAVASHIRLANDPNTDSETRQRLINDLKRDSEYVTEHGAQLSAAHQEYLSKDIYRGGPSVSGEVKQIAGTYLAAAGSRYDVESSNRSVDNRFINQLSKSQGELLTRYQASSEINNPDNTAATTAALRANQEGAREVLDTLYRGGGDREKQSFESAQERRYAVQDKQLQEYLRTSPAAAEESGRYVESILRTDRNLDLSSDTFFMEQGRTERRFGSDWGSAGGETAEDAAAAGRSSTAYSRFKGAPEDAEEFLLVDAAGKQRYTLKLGAGGAFAIYGWSGDLVGSGQSASGLAGALKNLNVPFDETQTDANGKKIKFNPLRPDAFSAPVELQEETDISGINTAAAFRAATLGTLRSNEEIIAADDSRRAAEKSAADAAALAELDERMTDELGYTLRVNASGELPSINTIRPGMYVSPGAEEKGQIRSSDVTMVRDPAVDDALKSAGDLLQRVSPPAAIAGALLRTDSKRIDGAEDAEQQDFIVTQNEGALAELSDALISGSEMIGEANAGFNDWFKGLTGRKLIETEYGSREKSWADLAGELAGATPLQKGFMIAGNSLGITDAEPDFMTETRRSVNKQILEMPLYAGSLIKIGDSIASSGAEGGVPAAAAAAGFWGARAGEGIVSEAVSNPRKLTADLTAGLVVGAGVSAATRPIFIAGKEVAVVGGRGTGLINPHVRSVPWESNTEPYAQGFRGDILHYILDSKTVDVERVEKSKVWEYFENKNLKVNRPTHPDSNDYFGGLSKHTSYATPNEYSEIIKSAGEQVNIQASVGLFKKNGILPGLNTRILYMKNMPSVGQRLSPEDKALILDYAYGNKEMPAELQLRIYNVAQDMANELGVPVASITSKTLHYIGGKKRPAGMSTDAEAEVAVIVPNNQPGMIDPATGELKKQIKYKLPNIRFAGVESRYGVRVDIVDFEPGAKKKSNLVFPIENLRDTIKDTGFVIDNGKPTFYSKGDALYDAIRSERKIQKMKGELPSGPLDELAWGSHGREHAINVAKNAFELKKGSANPKIMNLDDKVIDAMAFAHDSYKLGDKEMYLPHAERTGFLIRHTQLGDALKREYVLTDDQVITVASAVEKHTRAKPNAFNRLINRTTATDALLATADRLELARFGVRPNPKKLFLRQVLDEPWSMSSGQLLPPAPKKGTFDLDEFVARAGRQTERTGELPRADVSRIIDGRYNEASKSYAAGTFAGALGLNAGRVKRGEKTGKAEKSDKLTDSYTKKDQRYFENYYRQKSSSRSGYYGRGRDYKFREDYGRGYGYGKREYPKGYDFVKGYSTAYTIEPKNYAGEYKRLDYLKPSSYVMGSKYSGDPYKAGKYNLGDYPAKFGLLPQKSQAPPQKRKVKDKKTERAVKRNRKFTIENVEIPIVRAEEALFSKKVDVLELPADKETFYQVGNRLTKRKPATMEKRKKRRSK